MSCWRTMFPEKFPGKTIQTLFPLVCAQTLAGKQFESQQLACFLLQSFCLAKVFSNTGCEAPLDAFHDVQAPLEIPLDAPLEQAPLEAPPIWKIQGSGGTSELSLSSVSFPEFDQGKACCLPASSDSFLTHSFDDLVQVSGDLERAEAGLLWGFQTQMGDTDQGWERGGPSFRVNMIQGQPDPPQGGQGDDGFGEDPPP